MRGSLRCRGAVRHEVLWRRGLSRLFKTHLSLRRRRRDFVDFRYDYRPFGIKSNRSPILRRIVFMLLRHFIFLLKSLACILNLILHRPT